MPRYLQLLPGDPAPWFNVRSASNPDYAFASAGGRYLVLCFFGTAADPHSRAALEAVRGRPELFDDAHASFFGVSVDPADEAEARVAESYPGYRFFFDFDRRVTRLYGALPEAADPEARGLALRRLWVVLDPTLRVVAVVPFAPDRSDIAATLDWVAALPPPDRFAGAPLQAPILLLPNVFEPELCARLIAAYEAHGGEESGVMR